MSEGCVCGCTTSHCPHNHLDTLHPNCPDHASIGAHRSWCEFCALDQVQPLVVAGGASFGCPASALVDWCAMVVASSDQDNQILSCSQCAVAVSAAFLAEDVSLDVAVVAEPSMLQCKVDVVVPLLTEV